MKKASIWSILLTLCITSAALAANLATISIQNDGFTEKFKYSIDIYAISTGDDFGVGDTTIALQFNDAVLSNYVLSNQNALFHSNANYGAMAIVLDPGGTLATNQIALSITLTGTAATLPNTDTRLATITFDIDNTPAVYRTETTGFTALIGLSSMISSPAPLPPLPAGAFLSWSDNLDDSLICTPEISGSPGTTADTGNLYDFTPTTTDVCNTIPSVGALVFSTTNDPVWSSFDDATGRLFGTPALADIGTYSNIVITATDGYGDSADLPAFDIQVSAGCSPPIISGNPPVTISAGSPYSFTPTVNNGCGVLTYSILYMPIWASFNTNTGELSGTPGAGDVGTTSGVIISVEDANTISDSLAAFNIQVTASVSASSGSGSGGSGGGGGGGGCFIANLLAP